VTALDRARAAQALYRAHARLGRRCDCAHGGLCPTARELNREADAAYRQLDEPPHTGREKESHREEKSA
jgi:hypothetical protein